MMATDSPQNPSSQPSPERTPVETRQGVISGRVLLVLVLSTLFAGLALAIGWVFSA